MTFVTVGIAVPPAIFQNLTVSVPESPAPRAIEYLDGAGEPIVQPNGIVRVALCDDVVSAVPLPGEPMAKTRPCGIDTPGFCANRKHEQARAISRIFFIAAP